MTVPSIKGVIAFCAHAVLPGLGFLLLRKKTLGSLYLGAFLFGWISLRFACSDSRYSSQVCGFVAVSLGLLICLSSLHFALGVGIAAGRRRLGVIMLCGLVAGIVVWNVNGILFFGGKKIWIAAANSDSLAPTVRNGDVLLFAGASSGRISRGDIVIFRLNERNKRILDLARIRYPRGPVAKRVVAVSGDQVTQADGSFIVHTSEGVTTHYKSLRAIPDWSKTLAEGQIIVLGDNWNDSVDSRLFGPVETRLVEGVAIRTLFRSQKRANGNGRGGGQSGMALR